MRHRKNSRRLGRQRSHYKATLRHLVHGLIISKSISTTHAKAKEAGRLAEKLVHIAKDKTVANQRAVFATLRNKDLVATLFNTIAPLFKERHGGYTRIMLTGKRRGDNSQMAILEFVEKPKPELAKPKEKKAKKEVTQPVKKAEEPREASQPTKEPEKPKAKEKKPKPKFFKRFFKRKSDM